MSRFLVAASCASVGLLSCIAAYAHHSVPAEYDLSKQAELEGVVTEVQFRNPHVHYILEVTLENGSTEEWSLSAANISSLRRYGWVKDTIRVGDHISTFGDLGRNGAKKLRIQTVNLPDGSVIPKGDLAERSETDTVYADADYTYTYPTPAGVERPVNITGPWLNRYLYTRTVDDLEPKPTPFTEEGRRIYESHDEWDDPSRRCISPGLPRVFGSPYSMEIVDAGTHYVIIHVEYNTPRRIWMDGRQPTTDTPATSMGFSVGHWEGETLVVETTHLLPGWLDGSGLPMSGEGTRTVERFEVSENRLSMKRTMTIYDPYYSKPLVRYRGAARTDREIRIEQGSCDPDSYYEDMMKNGMLAGHFEH